MVVLACPVFSAAELQYGMRSLDRELSERTGQLRQLVKQNFDRFISCKTTIDDIYVKLHKIESGELGAGVQPVCCMGHIL